MRTFLLTVRCCLGCQAVIVREPVVAGRFYPETRCACDSQIDEFLSANASPRELPSTLYGGIVPHAGWVYSGAVAVEVFRALAASRQPDVLILFGGVHGYRGRKAALFASGRWETPLGTVEIDARLAERILSHTNLVTPDSHAHEEEHSLEVQLPFVQRLFPGVKVVPIMVPPTPAASEVGEAVARTIEVYDYHALVVGTTDLTHYGPQYGLVHRGVGVEANAWAKNENDRRFIDLMCAMRSTEVVAEANARKNACNAGAVAATMRAALALGASRGILLTHSTSSKVARKLEKTESENSVGYCGIVFA